MPAGPNPISATRRWALAAGLGLLGLGLNSLPVEIFAGIYLLPGHPPVVAAAVLLGPWAGMLAGAIASAITPMFWSHPWAVAVFALEGLAIGAWSRRVVPAVAGLGYWLLAAVPYGIVLGLVYPRGTATGIAVKTVAEASLAALVVQVALLAPPLHRLARPLLPPPLVCVRARTTVRSVVLLGALLPLFLLGIADARLVYARRLAEVDRANLARAESAAAAVATMVERAEDAVVRAAATGPGQAAQLLIREPVVRQAALLEDGRVVETASRSADDRDLTDLLRQLAPGAAIQELRLPDRDHGVLVVASPTLDGTLLVAVLDPEFLERALAARALGSSRLFLLGATDRVVASTAGAALDDRLRGGIAAAGDRGTSSFVSEPPPPRSLRAQATVRVAVAVAEPFEFRVVLAQDQGALQPQIEAEALGMFGGFTAAVLAAVVAGLILVQVIVTPVDRVARATRRLRRGERGARIGGSLGDAPLELQQLGQGFDRMAEEVERQLVAVDRAGQARDEFLSVASHELKTPLAILKAQIQLMERRPPESRERQLRTIARQVDRINRLVTQLLVASSVGPGAFPVERQELELSELIRRVVADLRAVSPGRELRLELAEVWGRWDELRIEQVLHNLIGNALKYSPAEAPVDVILAARPGEGAELRIADRGSGIRPEDLDRVFRRFSRGASTAWEGLGVGLYVVRTIVELHGGTVSLTPREGGGTVATVFLPRDVPGGHAPGRASPPAKGED